MFWELLPAIFSLFNLKVKLSIVTRVYFVYFVWFLNIITYKESNASGIKLLGSCYIFKHGSNYSINFYNISKK